MVRAQEFQPAFEVELLGNERDIASLGLEVSEQAIGSHHGLFKEGDLAALAFLRLIWTRATNFIGGWQRGPQKQRKVLTVCRSFGRSFAPQVSLASLLPF